MDCLFTIKYKNYLPNHKYQRFFSPILSSEFIILALTFGSVIHFELFNTKVVRF